MLGRTKAFTGSVLALLLIVALCIPYLSCDMITINPDTGEIIIEAPSEYGGNSVTGASWQLPSIESFNASPSTVSPGDIATIEWDVFGATEITIDQGIGVVDRTGSTQVLPVSTTTYIITATNTSGSVSKSVTVTMGTTTASESPPSSSPQPSQFTPSSSSPQFTPSSPAPSQFTPSPTPSSPTPSSPPAPLTPPVINTFTASPSSIVAGGISNLVWSVTGATSIHIGPGGGYVSSSGSVIATPSVTTTYTLTAANAAGTVTRTVTVTVATAVTPPVIISFSANPSSLSGSGMSLLTWSTSGATSVTLSPGGGSVPASGSATATLSSTRTYTLTASNSAGSVNRTVTVTVAAAPASPPPASPPATPPVINSFTASPTSISAGGTSTLTWNVTNATSISLSPGGGSVPASGSATATLSSTRTYTLTASNSAGSVNRTVTVTVAAAPASPPPASPPSSGDAATCEQALFNSVNAIRTSNGKAALSRNSYMDGLCRQHAQYMATANDLSHDNFSTRCSQIQSNVSGMHACAENVLQANMPCDATDMAQMWYNSSGHRTNMLNTAYTQAGMGIVIDGSGKIWACQIFAGP